MQIFFFEDDYYRNFHPLTLTRPIDDLRLGLLTIGEKWGHTYTTSASCSRLVRPELKELFPHSHLVDTELCLWINSRYLPSETLLDEVQNMDPGTCLKTEETVVAARVDAATTQTWLQKQQPDFNTLMVLEGSGYPHIEHLWDLYKMNDEEIVADLQRLGSVSSDKTEISSQAILQNKEEIIIEEGATIAPGAILLADDGPVYIGKGATIMAGAIIQGPTAVCDNATVKIGAKIYHGTTIGPVCKVGGEVNNSIFHSYSNKGHDGFVGNSLIGQWCNIGADTNTSNLKNNYSHIRIADWESREEIETGQQFFGAVLADHTKTAINTQLNTGTVCGVSCNIFSGDFPPKFIPSFSWVGSNVIQPYKIDKALETMQAMMTRRDVELTEDYKKLMRHIFESEHS